MAGPIRGKGCAVNTPVTTDVDHTRATAHGTAHTAGVAAGHLWQQELRDAYQNVAELVADGFMAAESTTQPTVGGRYANKHNETDGRYKFRLPKYYAALIDKNDPHCPIAAQALPKGEELDPELPDELRSLSEDIYGRPTPWTADAIGDIAKLGAPRLTHRYGNRALLHVTTSCALYCRFCFRKAHMGNHEEALYSGDYSEALSYLSRHPEIREVILTGGDPLSLTDGAIKGLILKLTTAAPHLRVIRLHTRMPVTLPSRITAELVAALKEARADSAAGGVNIAVVAHFNHPKELTPVALEKINLLLEAGFPIYNQSVLLRGVNNNSFVLSELFSALYEHGVRPMYLHHTDYTPGTFHFRVSINEGRRIYRALRGVCAGPALPRYVLDVPGGGGKTDIIDEDFVQITDLGALHSVAGGPIGAAVYEVPLCASTKGGGSGRWTEGKTRYLDLFPATEPL